ncbi:hypothetical protein Goklo_010971 [Gossypium klotzschianum]|uniref:Plant bHLH transcription factor ACT-like domain-containing protein n=2 Tax=Gossypium TaxID=3633 RepID=A0A7J8V8C3_9ROSI|nr:hypothetical protein [Gossypium klotzschianum]
MVTKLQRRTASRRKLQFLPTLSNTKSEVKVEKVGEEFVVKVSCNKGRDKLISILEAFEELDLNVVRARVNCSHFFAMEAIAVAQDQKTTDINDVTQAILMAIEKQGGEHIKDFRQVSKC